MESDVSKSQKEVWEWKESLFDELKNVPKSERLKFIRDKAKRAIEKLNRTSPEPRVA